LNEWKWPPEIPNEEKLAAELKDMPRRMSMLHWIDVHIGGKEILRTHWETEGFDLSEFDEFWRIHFESKDQQEIDAYHDRRRQEYMKHEEKLSLTGHPRSYYKELHAKKEAETGMKLSAQSAL
jgi:hypothetical protein